MMSFLILAKPGHSFVYSPCCASLSCNRDYETPSLFIAVSMETTIVHWWYFIYYFCIVNDSINDYYCYINISVR